MAPGAAAYTKPSNKSQRPIPAKIMVNTGLSLSMQNPARNTYRTGSALLELGHHALAARLAIATGLGNKFITQTELIRADNYPGWLLLRGRT